MQLAFSTSLIIDARAQARGKPGFSYATALDDSHLSGFERCFPKIVTKICKIYCKNKEQTLPLPVIYCDMYKLIVGFQFHSHD